MKPFLIAMTLLCSAYAVEGLPPINHVVPFTSMNIEQATAFAKGETPDLVVICEAGTELPIKYFGNFKLFSISWTPNIVIKIEETFYLRCVGKKTYMSFDLKEWESASKFLDGKMPFPKVEVDRSGISIETNLVDMPEDLPFDWEDGDSTDY